MLNDDTRSRSPRLRSLKNSENLSSYAHYHPPRMVRIWRAAAEKNAQVAKLCAPD